MKYAYIILVACVFFSCNNEAHRRNTVAVKASGKPFIKKTVIAATSINEVKTSFPIDTTYEAHILTSGIFHKDEVNPDLQKQRWVAIFRNKKDVFLKPTEISITQVRDEIVDEENEKTGWDVKSVAHPDSALLFISTHNYLKSKAIKEIKLTKSELLPDEQENFAYQNATYTLYATGQKKSERPGSNNYQVSNYRLFIKAVIKGHTYQQLLAAESTFDDALTQIIFAGDIDGDDIPDLILDTTNHYNVIRTTLYLSKPANNGNLLKIAGMRTQVGC
jgi:hypothetical protein